MVTYNRKPGSHECLNTRGFCPSTLFDDPWSGGVVGSTATNNPGNLSALYGEVVGQDISLAVEQLREPKRIHKGLPQIGGTDFQFWILMLPKSCYSSGRCKPGWKPHRLAVS